MLSNISTTWFVVIGVGVAVAAYVAYTMFKAKAVKKPTLGVPTGLPSANQTPGQAVRQGKAGESGVKLK